MYKDFLECPYLKILQKKFDVRIVPAHEAQYFFVNETWESRRDFFQHGSENVTSILISGEAMSPDFNLFDYSIAFDPLLYADRYLRHNPALRFKTSLNSALSIQQSFSEKLFCDFIYSNFKANPMRDQLKSMMHSISKVDSYGKHLNNMGSKLEYISKELGWEKAKVQIQSQYRFSIVAENAFHLGYTSEKIFHSFSAGTIPIYWGNPQIELDVNPKRIINVHSFNSQEDLIAFIVRINSDENLYLKIISEPWFTPEQEECMRTYPSRLEEFLNNIFYSPEPRRKSQGTFNKNYTDVVGYGIKFGLIQRFLREAFNLGLLPIRIKSRLKKLLLNFKFIY